MQNLNFDFSLCFAYSHTGSLWWTQYWGLPDPGLLKYNNTQIFIVFEVTSRQVLSDFSKDTSQLANKWLSPDTPEQVNLY